MHSQPTLRSAHWAPRKAATDPKPRSWSALHPKKNARIYLVFGTALRKKQNARNSFKIGMNFGSKFAVQKELYLNITILGNFLGQLL